MQQYTSGFARRFLKALRNERRYQKKMRGAIKRFSPCIRRNVPNTVPLRDDFAIVPGDGERTLSAGNDMPVLGNCPQAALLLDGVSVCWSSAAGFLYRRPGGHNSLLPALGRSRSGVH